MKINLKHFTSSFLALFFGFFVPFGIFYLMGGVSFDFHFGGKTDIAALSSAPRQTETISLANSAVPITTKSAFGRVPISEFSIPAIGKVLESDLSQMKFRLYEDKQLLKEFDILSIGKKDSPWETPVGKYRVVSREEKHFSTLGNVWMPYSVQFFGNFFVHGWPYYPGGMPVAEGFSGGCIRLSTEDAKEVFDFAEHDTIFFVVDRYYSGSDTKLPGEESYFSRNEYEFPKIGAEAFLIADLDTGQIIKSKNQNEAYPIASVTKLMTALVSLETMNQYQKTIISESAVATYGQAGSLYEGQEILVKELIYPLLLESSNDAAVALAEQAGVKNFMSAMNERAKSIGLLSTYYEEPSGLSDKNVSTVEDLFRLAQYIYQSKRYVLNVTQKRSYDYWYSNNSFIGNKYFLGGKNGYTPEAKRTAVTLLALPLSEFKDRRVAVVLLGTDTRERDVTRIINWLKADVFYGEKPPEEEREEITSFVFVGDIMMDRGVENSVLLNNKGDFSFVFEKTAFLKDIDVAFGNLEGSISDKGEDLGSANSFRFEPDSLDALKSAGFDVLSVANNHAGDWGREAFEDSLERLKEKDITTVGGGLNIEEAVTVKILEKNGIKIGFLGFSDVGPDWLKAEENKSGVSVAGDNLGFLVQQASKEVDVLIVSIHFGEEYEEMSNDRQKYLAHLAVDNGAKIVIGHHPHVIQKVENYKGAVVAYSLGNFVFDQNFSESTMTGLALEIYLSGDNIASVEQKTIKINKSFQPSLVF